MADLFLKEKKTRQEVIGILTSQKRVGYAKAVSLVNEMADAISQARRSHGWKRLFGGVLRIAGGIGVSIITIETGSGRLFWGAAVYGLYLFFSGLFEACSGDIP